MAHLIIIVASLTQFFAITLYVREIVKGNVKPNRVSWLMWSVAPLTATAAAVSNGVTWATLPVFMQGFGPLIVFLSTFVNKNAYWKLNSFDYLCGFFSLLALVLWAVTGHATIAIVFAVVSDIFAALPTLTKSWHHPETENGVIYIISIITALTSFLVINWSDFSSYAFPVYLVFIDIALTVSVYHSKIKQSITR